jgi:hypothetical protein
MTMQFALNRPVEVALKFDTGFPVKSQIDGRDQVMFTLVGEEKMYLDPLVATRIERMGLKKGERFVICKRRLGRSIEWNFTRPGDSAEPAAAPESPDHIGLDDLPAPRPVARETLIEALRAAIRVLEGGR